MLFEIPHKPDDMPLEIWTALLRRSGNRCEMNCPSPCDRALEVDHVHARALGGETSLANCRLVCRCYNRERGAQANEKWASRFWFDERASFDGLRVMQMVCGPNAVAACADLFVSKRRDLLRYISLLAMVTGAGKTLTAVALLLAINEEVNRRVAAAPRVGRVLWFVNERALGDQLRAELSGKGGQPGEVVQIGLHPLPPSVQICSEPGDLERGPMHHDFTISCPHALWDRRDQKRDDAEVALILAKFDTIIWDECDFASDQLGRLARLAPHALKFGLTATPIDGDGEFLRQFALAGKASYEMVFQQDRCLAPLLPWGEAQDNGYVKAVPHSAYCALDSGIEVRQEGQHGDKTSLPGGLAAIRHAIVEASDIERRMRVQMPEQWYSPHILVRCGSIAEARHLRAQVDRDLEAGMFKLTGEGWRTTIIHQGMRGVPPEEMRLFHDRKGMVHPFLRAKDQRGRCDQRGCRILFAVDMGMRGLNNWPTLIVVDIARGNSVNVQVQLLGRPMRLPFHLGAAARDQDLQKFVAIRYFYPDSGGSPGAMQEAVSFVLEMDERFDAAGLIGWQDILDGTAGTVGTAVQAAEQPFTLGDRVQVDAELGLMIEDGRVVDEAAVEEILQRLPPVLTATRRQRAVEHIERVLGDESYRQELISTDSVQIIRPVSREEPKRPGEHSLEEMLQFAQENEEYGGEVVLAELRKQMPGIMLTISRVMHDQEMRFYRQPVRLFRLQSNKETNKGIATQIATALFQDLAKRRLLDESGKEGQRDVYRAVNGAIALIFGCKDVSNDGPLDQPSYHHAMLLPRTQSLIKETAVKYLIRYGVIAHAGAVYLKDQDCVA